MQNLFAISLSISCSRVRGVRLASSPGGQFGPSIGRAARKATLNDLQIKSNSKRFVRCVRLCSARCCNVCVCCVYMAMNGILFRQSETRPHFCCLLAVKSSPLGPGRIGRLLITGRSTRRCPTYWPCTGQCPVRIPAFGRASF